MPRLFESGFNADGTYTPNPYFMEEAMSIGERCLESGDHPVGAIITGITTSLPSFRFRPGFDDAEPGQEVIIGASGNLVHVKGDPTAHAELYAIRRACEVAGRLALSHSVLYTTHECCPMCAGGVANTKLAGVVYASSVEDIEGLLTEQSDIKWRSNEVRMSTILEGRKEANAKRPFIIGGFMREEGIALLKRSSELATYRERVQTFEEWVNESGLSDEEAASLLRTYTFPERQMPVKRLP